MRTYGGGGAAPVERVKSTGPVVLWPQISSSIAFWKLCVSFGAAVIVGAYCTLWLIFV